MENRNTKVLVKIYIKAYLVKGLFINILLSTNTLNRHNFQINFKIRQAIIFTCYNTIFLFLIIFKLNYYIKLRLVYTKKAITILPKKKVIILIKK